MLRVTEFHHNVIEMFSNWLTSATASTSAMPTAASVPDVILEIGPMPMTRQFVAHSAILIAHSGYLRSIIRPDERIPDCPIYVPNITAEHFAPLLTYMYTGYLDLNIENIFGVLLATHVLHMPRALEICRNYLARIQSEGYGTGSAMSFEKTAIQQQQLYGDSVRIVRPIASKAATSGFAFVAPPMAKAIAYSHDTPFKSFNLPINNDSNNNDGNMSDKSEAHIEVDSQSNDRDNDEIKRESPAVSTPQLVDVDRITPDESVHLTTAPKPERFGKKPKKIPSNTKSEEKVVAQPVSDRADKEDDDDNFIIDVACCDGPVRFQRVLNEAYNRSPLKQTLDANSGGSNHQLESQRAQVTNAFHIQMAKNISERQTIGLDAGADSENSNDNGHLSDRSTKKAKKMKTMHCVNATDSAGAATAKHDEIFSCVYCNHTFKSQYCYQKHAKRHLNPLSLDGGVINSDRDEKCENVSTASNKSATISMTPTMPTNRSGGCSSGGSIGGGKREVRPLDMNVQYYPCKTCGSKFPSYYFVHKHRKICHANEDN